MSEDQSNDQNNKINTSEQWDSVASRIDDLLGFNATKNQPNQDSLNAALEELKQERQEKLHQESKKILSDLLDLRQKEAEIDKKYAEAKRGAIKAANKLLAKAELNIQQK